MKHKKVIYFCFILFFIFLFTFATEARISDWATKLDLGAVKTNIYETSSADSSSVQIAKYIGGIMAMGAFLGAIFIIYIVIAGYEWMTAQGNEEKIAKAQKRIFYATIGILILAGLYLFADFFISRLGWVTGYKI